MSENTDKEKDKSTEVIETKIEAVKEEIATTPNEDKDNEWQTKISLTLDKISERLDKQAETTGSNPEIAALMQAVSRLEAKLAETPATPPVQPPPSQNDADVSPIPETKKETQSALPQKKAQDKQKRAWL